jgi:hypothetical protein
VEFYVILQQESPVLHQTELILFQQDIASQRITSHALLTMDRLATNNQTTFANLIKTLMIHRFFAQLMMEVIVLISPLDGISHMMATV